MDLDLFHREFLEFKKRVEPLIVEYENAAAKREAADGEYRKVESERVLKETAERETAERKAAEETERQRLKDGKEKKP